MKLKFFFLTTFLIGLNSLAQNRNSLIIKNVSLLTMCDSSVLKNKSVLIEQGKIVKIGRFETLSKNKNTLVIEGKGKYLMPGLAEMHSHLPVENKVDSLLIENVAAGVVHLRIMNTQTSQMQLKARLKNNPAAISPKLHYSHIIRADIQYTETQFDSLMVEIKKNEIKFIKLFSIANEEIFDNLMKSANKNKVFVCGHYPSAVKIEKVLNSGFRSIEHLGGYTQITDAEALLKTIKLTQEKRVFNCPTLDYYIMAYDLQYPNEYKNRLVYANAPKKQLDRWEREYSRAIEKTGVEKVLLEKEQFLPAFAYKQNVLKKLNETNCLLLLGSDAGNVFQMNGFNMYEEMDAWSKAGIDNLSILKSATINAALFFGEDKIWGSLEVGKSADLLLLEKNPLEDIRNIKTVEMTLIDGKVYRKKDLLKKLYPF